MRFRFYPCQTSGLFFFWYPLSVIRLSQKWTSLLKFLCNCLVSHFITIDYFLMSWYHKSVFDSLWRKNASMPLIYLTSIDCRTEQFLNQKGKVVTRLVLLRFVICLTISRQLLNHWEAKPKPSAPCIKVIAVNSVSFIVQLAPVVVFRSNNFGIVFSTVIWKPPIVFHQFYEFKAKEMIMCDTFLCCGRFSTQACEASFQLKLNGKFFCHTTSNIFTAIRCVT